MGQSRWQLELFLLSQKIALFYFENLNVGNYRVQMGRRS